MILIYALGKRCLFVAFVLSFSFFQSANAQQFLTKIGDWNAYVHLPDDYNDGTNQTYPLIIFVPGLGECGTNPSKLLTYGPSKFIAEGNTMQFTVDGKTVKPIVISMQPVNTWPSPASINDRIDSILLRWRVDPKKINGTGLSMGGWAWQNYIDGYSLTYTNRLASMVVMSAVPPDNTIPKMKTYAENGGKWWGFEGTQDYRLMDIIRDTLNSGKAAAAHYTQYVGGHCCWNTWYNPSWTEGGENIYTWMMKQTRADETALPVILLDFIAMQNGKTALIKWQTTEEVKSDYFVVERSIDGTNYSNLTNNIPAVGQGSSIRNYQAIDYNPSAGINYYRLKMVDIDGSFEYSKVLTVQMKGIKGSPIVIGGIIRNGRMIDIRINSLKQAAVSMTISDATGRVLQQFRANLVAGLNTISRPAGLSKGMYYVTLIQADGTRQTVPFFNN